MLFDDTYRLGQIPEIRPETPPSLPALLHLPL